MEKQIKEVLKNLKKRKWHLGVMESCTGGAVANLITNIPGASDVFVVGKVTYSNEAKFEAGVDREIVEKYGVYSNETATEMSRKIKGEIGIGVTGQLPGKVFVAIRVGEVVRNREIKVKSCLKDKVTARKKMKLKLVEMIVKDLTFCIL